MYLFKNLHVGAGKQKNGDLFSDLYSEYNHRIHAIALNIVGDKHEAEDVAQDTFIKIYRSLSKFRGLDREEIIPLVAIYTKNTALDHLRKRKRQIQTVDLGFDDDGGEKELEPASQDIGPEELVLTRERAMSVAEAIDSLPEKQRHVIILRYRYDMTEKEIARVMSTTESAVSSCVDRAKKTLRASIGGD